MADDETVGWKSYAALRGHFQRHRRALGLRTIAEYEASALETIRNGIRFEYFAPQIQRWRVGYFEPATRRFTALDEDELEIESHFRAPERYVRNLLRSTYPL